MPQRAVFLASCYFLILIAIFPMKPGTFSWPSDTISLSLTPSHSTGSQFMFRKKKCFWLTDWLIPDWSLKCFPSVFFFKLLLGKFQTYPKIERIMIHHVPNTWLQSLTIHDPSSYIHPQMPVPHYFKENPSFGSQYFNIYLWERMTV